MLLASVFDRGGMTSYSQPAEERFTYCSQMAENDTFLSLLPSASGFSIVP